MSTRTSLDPSSLPQWPTPSDAGVGALGISAFLNACEQAPGVELHGMVLVTRGQVVAQGWWAPYERDRVHLVYSLSKSFTATALGLAVAEGLVDLDATVLSYFPELDAQVTDERSRRILVRHVAAMASGHAEETVRAAALADPEGDLLRGFLQLPPEAEPGSLFTYNQPCTYALSRIVQRVTGCGLLEYLRPRLLDPLGIGELGWILDAQGRELGYSGLHARTEDVAKLGLLHLQNGRWQNGRWQDGKGEHAQVLTPEWVAEATRSHVASRHDQPDWQQGYGFQFWQARHGYRGDGAYGQFCVVLPEHDTVLAVTSQSPDMQAVLDAAWTHLLPALSSGGDGPAADEALAARLGSAELPGPTGSAELSLQPGRFTGDDLLDGVEIRRAGEESQGFELVLTQHGADVVAALGPQWSTTGPVATRAARDGDLLRVAVVFCETPHRLQLELDTAAGTCASSWMTVPLHGVPLAVLRNPADLRTAGGGHG